MIDVRSDFIQYRAGNKEGNSDGTRLAGGSSGKHFKGEKSGVLAFLSLLFFFFFCGGGG